MVFTESIFISQKNKSLFPEHTQKKKNQLIGGGFKIKISTKKKKNYKKMIWRKEEDGVEMSENFGTAGVRETQKTQAFIQNVWFPE